MLIRKFTTSVVVFFNGGSGTLGIDLKTFRELKKKSGKNQLKKSFYQNTFHFERPNESCCYGKKAPAFSNEQSPLYVTPPGLHQHIPPSASGGGALFCFSSNSKRNLLVDQAIYCYPPI